MIFTSISLADLIHATSAPRCSFPRLITAHSTRSSVCCWGASMLLKSTKHWICGFVSILTASFNHAAAFVAPCASAPSTAASAVRYSALSSHTYSSIYLEQSIAVCCVAMLDCSDQLRLGSGVHPCVTYQICSRPWWLGFLYRLLALRPPSYLHFGPNDAPNHAVFGLMAYCFGQYRTVRISQQQLLHVELPVEIMVPCFVSGTAVAHIPTPACIRSGHDNKHKLF